MSARLAVLPGPDDGADVKRWTLCAAIVCAVHAGLIGSYLLLPAQPPIGALQSPAVIIDLAPLPVAPSSEADLAPGPQMVESTAQPQQLTETEPQKVEPMPSLQAPAEVTLPPPVEKPAEQKPIEQPEVQKPEPLKAEERTPAPRTTANPRFEQRPAPVARAASPGSAESNAAIATWRDLVVARLQQSKRYPSAAEARREQGVVTLHFSVDRHGKVLSRSIARSSGHPALDEEVLALVQRAQPLPAFPAAMPQSVVHLTVPIRFSVR